jgi:hypothetical protein
MIDQLHKEYTDRGYTWKVDGKEVTPTRQDIADFLAEAQSRCGDGMQLQAGHIIVQNIAGHTDVYLHLGEYTDE